MLRPWRYPEARRRIARSYPKLDPPGIALVYVRLFCILMYPALLGFEQGAERIIRGEESPAALLFGLVLSIPFIVMFIGYYRQASYRRFIIRFRYFWGISSLLSLMVVCIAMAALVAGERIIETLVAGLVGGISSWLSIRALRISWRDTGDTASKGNPRSLPYDGGAPGMP